MNDREMLKLAAKAAGYTVHYDESVDNYGYVEEIGSYWNPLEKYGDALQLAVSLNIAVLPGCRAQVDYPYGLIFGEDALVYNAVCRAIVRAAAELGKRLT